MDDLPTINEDEIVGVASALSSGERAAYLETACRGHAALRARIEQRIADEVPAAKNPSASSNGATLAAFTPEKAGDRLGAYRLLEQIGEGGFGTVWVAEQDAPVKRRVALKIVKMGMDTKQVIARFEQERQALALMDHPNIAKVFDAGVTQSGRPFFVMELVRGVRITDFCDQSHLAMNERIQLFITVCRAVQHAHVKGIVHRDLKPSNLLVSYHDGAADPKIIDFGVAKAIQSQRLTDLTIYTRYEQMIGTPAYMSPEQAGMSALDIDSRSDVYSLGALLFELLTGRPPFDPKEYGDFALDEFRRILREHDPKRPSSALAATDRETRIRVARSRQIDDMDLIDLLRGDLDWIVMKAIAKDRTLRYETPNELAADLHRYLGRRPVVARPPSTLYRFRRFVARHKTGVASAACVTAALVIGFGVSIWQAVLVTKEAKRANDALAKIKEIAPSLQAEARELVSLGKFNDAIKKMDYAIGLYPNSVDFLRYRASLYRSQFRFASAAQDYRNILGLSNNDASARINVGLCERLVATPKERNGTLPRAALIELRDQMVSESRPDAERLPVLKALGDGIDLQRKVWLARLRDLTNSSPKPLNERLTTEDGETFDLDLKGTKVSDLSLLSGLPVRSLDASGCSDVQSIECFRKTSTLKTLKLSGTKVDSLEALAGCSKLEELNLEHANHIIDLTPLRALPLKSLNIGGTQVSDISPLENSPITQLAVGSTQVTNLEPIKRMSLEMLECSFNRIEDYSPLAATKIERLAIQGATSLNLAILRELPLESLVLTGATKVRNYGVLKEIKSLRILLLPASPFGRPFELTPAEVDEIEALRHHPNLERLSSTVDYGISANSAETAKEFWRDWDLTAKWWRHLKNAGIPFTAERSGDGLWTVHVMGQPLNDLSIFAGAPIGDLNVTGCKNIKTLRGLESSPLRILRISETEVSDLAPLKDLRLTELWMATTKVKDLNPLRGMPLQLLFMDKCTQLTDVSPIAELKQLDKVLLPFGAVDVEKLQSHPKLNSISYSLRPGSLTPACKKAAFFANYKAPTWISALRPPKLNERQPATQLIDGTWKVIVNNRSFEDLKVFGSAPISELHLNDSSVADLKPLTALPLKRLRIDNTKCREVGPLAEIKTLEWLVIPADVDDLDKLRNHPGLKRLSSEADPSSGEPRHDVEEFWKLHPEPKPQ